VHLINKEHSWHQLSDALVDVPVDHLVDLSSQFLSDLGFLGFHYLAHQTHEVVAALGTSICHVQIVKSHILHNFLLLVDVALGERHVFFSFEVELAGIGIASTDPLDVASGGFDVDDISD